MLYEDLEDILITPEESRVTQKTNEDSQNKAEDIQKEAGVTQEEPEDTQEKAENTQEEAGLTQEIQPLEQPKRASGLLCSFDTPIPLPAATFFPEDSHRDAPPLSPSLSPSNKDPH